MHDYAEICSESNPYNSIIKHALSFKGLIYIGLRALCNDIRFPDRIIDYPWFLDNIVYNLDNQHDCKQTQPLKSQTDEISISIIKKLLYVLMKFITAAIVKGQSHPRTKLPAKQELVPTVDAEYNS